MVPVNRVPRSGRPHATTAGQDAAILGAIDAQPMPDATKIWRELGKQNVVVIFFCTCLDNGSENYSL